LHIAESNKFPHRTITKLKTQIEKNTTTQTKPQKDNKKWAIFTYYNQNIRKLTNLFKTTDLNIAFRSTNNIQQLKKPKPHYTTPELERSGIYKLTCRGQGRRGGVRRGRRLTDK
jgi:hypothetical protein